MNKFKIGALMLARSGSSFLNKNIIEISGYPVMAFGMLAAKETHLIDYYYLSSDSDDYLTIGEEYGYKPIRRPDILSKSSSKSDDAVLHAYKSIDILKDCDILIVQHANVVTIYPELIIKSINILTSDKSITSVVPAHINNEYNPNRSFCLNKNTIEPFIEYNETISPNRQDLPNAYFLDHSFWCIRTENLLKNHNFCPWNSLGNKILPVLTKDMFDIHSEEDVNKSIIWLNENKDKTKYLK
jgi:CMP-N-acetylneuraminic acid synthetase